MQCVTCVDTPCRLNSWVTFFRQDLGMPSYEMTYVHQPNCAGATNIFPSSAWEEINDEYYGGEINFKDFEFRDEIPLELPSIFESEIEDVNDEMGYVSHGIPNCEITESNSLVDLSFVSNNDDSAVQNTYVIMDLTNFSLPARSTNLKKLSPTIKEPCSSNRSVFAGYTKSKNINPIAEDEENCSSVASAGFTNYNLVHGIGFKGLLDDISKPVGSKYINPVTEDEGKCSSIASAGFTNYSLVHGIGSKGLLDDIKKPIGSEDRLLGSLEGHNKSSLSSVLSGVHFCQTFKLSSKKSPVLTLDRIVEVEDDFLDLCSVTKPNISVLKIQKLGKIHKLRNKRSLVYCENLIRGLALAEKWAEIKSENLDAKTLNNKFSNFQRPDRKHGAGEKLYRSFMNKNSLTALSSRKEIEVNCKVTFGIFGDNGHLKYVSSNASKGMLFFFQDDYEMFLIKNLKGFCRID